jgi:hypothetical protein
VKRKIFPYQHTYSVGDIALDVKTDSTFFFERVQQHLNYLPPADDIRCTSSGRISLHFITRHTDNPYLTGVTRLSPASKRIMHDYRIFRSGSIFVLREVNNRPPAMVVIDMKRHILSFVAPPARLKPERPGLPFPLTYFLQWLLWSARRILLHAACVAKDGYGILIPGPRGSGKTLLALYMLLRGEFNLVSNDKVVLADRGTQVEAIGIHRPIIVRKGVLDLLPGLKRYLRKGEKGVPEIDPKEAFPGRLSQSTPVTHIILPGAATPQKGIFKPEPIEVLNRLIVNAGVIPVKQITDGRLRLLWQLILGAESLCIPRQLVPNYRPLKGLLR